LRLKMAGGARRGAPQYPDSLITVNRHNAT
jgi:hypothetical protein